jgi:hypothetical protein
MRAIPMAGASFSDQDLHPFLSYHAERVRATSPGPNSWRQTLTGTGRSAPSGQPKRLGRIGRPSEHRRPNRPLGI